jgi:hypothetical protein
MRKLIAILERDPARTAIMNAWLEDRLVMYEHLFFKFASDMIQEITQRPSVVLALCIGEGSEQDRDFQSENAFEFISEYLLKQTERFPVLLHAFNFRHLQDAEKLLIQAGWQVDRVQAMQGTDWIADSWYPALKRSLRNNSCVEKVAT